MRVIYTLCSVALMLVLTGCEITRMQAARRGRADARKELDSGVMALEVCGYGLGPPTRPEKYLAERGAQIRLVGGCMPSDEVLGHSEGFNEVMIEGMKKKLGSDVLIRAGYEN